MLLFEYSALSGVILIIYLVNLKFLNQHNEKDYCMNEEKIVKNGFNSIILFIIKLYPNWFEDILTLIEEIITMLLLLLFIFLLVAQYLILNIHLL